MRLEKLFLLGVSISLGLISAFVPSGRIVLSSAAALLFFYSMGFSKLVIGSIFLALMIGSQNVPKFDWKFDIDDEPGYSSLGERTEFEGVELVSIEGKDIEIHPTRGVSIVIVPRKAEFKRVGRKLKLRLNMGGKVLVGRNVSIVIYGVGNFLSGDFKVPLLKVNGVSNSIRGNFEGLEVLKIYGVSNEVNISVESSKGSFEISGTSNRISIDLTGLEDGDFDFKARGVSNEVDVVLSKGSKVRIGFEGEPSFLNHFNLRRR